jgi:aminoglycoside N3'-acetyltransferase
MPVINHVISRADLVDAFRAVGLGRGDAVIIHAAMSSLGYVANGGNDILQAALDAIGPDGTLVASTNTGQLTDPGGWKNPAIAPEALDKLRHAMQPFDPQTTPAWRRGAYAEALLAHPDRQRSSHPLRSLAAIGRDAAAILRDHPLDDPEGIGSPIHKLYEADGMAILCGADFSSLTALHLAESLASPAYLDTSTCLVRWDGAESHNGFRQLRRISFAPHLARIEPVLYSHGLLRRVTLGGGAVVGMKIRAVVDIARQTLERDPFFFHRVDACAP